MPIIKFYSKNCASCLQAQEIIDLVNAKYKAKNIFLDTIDIDTLDPNNSEVLNRYGVIPKKTILPCIVIVDKNGLEINRINGKFEPDTLRLAINRMNQIDGKKTLLDSIKFPNQNQSKPSGSENFNKPEFEPISEAINDFKSKLSNQNNNSFDIRSDEDLSLAIMNLISIEEHLFFTANRTKKDSYYGLLEEVREIRKMALKLIITSYEGENWCTCKHLLAASMRFMEVGTKQLSAGKGELAKEMFEKSYHLYLLFWKIVRQTNDLESNPSADSLEDINCCNE